MVVGEAWDLGLATAGAAGAALVVFLAFAGELFFPVALVGLTALAGLAAFGATLALVLGVAGFFTLVLAGVTLDLRTAVFAFLAGAFFAGVFFLDLAMGIWGWGNTNGQEPPRNAGKPCQPRFRRGRGPSASNAGSGSGRIRFRFER